MMKTDMAIYIFQGMIEEEEDTEVKLAMTALLHELSTLKKAQNRARIAGSRMLKYARKYRELSAEA